MEGTGRVGVAVASGAALARDADVHERVGPERRRVGEVRLATKPYEPIIITCPSEGSFSRPRECEEASCSSERFHNRNEWDEDQLMELEMTAWPSSGAGPRTSSALACTAPVM